MADTDQLKDMLDNIINDKSEQAQINFHDYLQGKMKDTLGVEVADVVDQDTTDEE